VAGYLDVIVPIPTKRTRICDQPREKLAKLGSGNLTEVELLALILRTGKKGSGVLKMAGNLLRKHKLVGLAQMSLTDLQEIAGIGKSKACGLVAVFELAKRLNDASNKSQKVYLSPRDFESHFEDYRKSRKEYILAFYLNARSQLIYKELISLGTADFTVIHPREVFEPAITHNAISVVLAHNHPSGCVDPSLEDIKITKELVEAGRILGIKLVDHILFTATEILSFKAKNLI